MAIWSVLTRPLPEGGWLPDEAWARRHRGMLLLLGLHATVLGVAGTIMGRGAEPSAAVFWLVLAVAAVIGCNRSAGRPWRAAAVAVGLMACSAYLVELTGGLTESHFHFFVVLAAITLYQDWFPFLVAFGAVLLYLLTFGVIVPDAVFAGPAAQQHPLAWALLHVAYLLMASAASLVSWRLGERERSRAELLLDSTADGIYGLDREGRITFTNAAMERLLGAEAARLAGRHHHEALGHADAEGQSLPREHCPVCLTVAAGRGERTEGAHLTRTDGGTLPVEYAGTLIWEKGRVTGTVVTFRDLTERTRLARKAMHDELTGLANRTLLLEHLERALARLQRQGGTAALLFCDLDCFKAVNDRLGHAAGDELLVEVAGRLLEAVRAHDTVARFGGDEFVVLCTDLDAEHDVLAIAERITGAFAAPFAAGGTRVPVSVSIGIALAEPNVDAGELVRQADEAMYRAKQRGRDRVEVFDARLRDQAERRTRMEGDLRRALERGELRVHYQPKVSLADEALTGVEALVRWQHPELGLVAPDEFLSVAEDSGLIVPLGAWVLEEACRQVQRWRAAHPRCERLTLSVNVSARQLADTRLTETVREALAITGLPPSLLCLEIREQILMADAPRTVEVLHGLKRLGITLAVDNFGTGWSSLSYLTRVPVDVLKVDRSFVRSLDEAPDSWSVVAAAIGLSRSLGLSTVAEGVERDAQAAVLRGLGCELAQGYHFARPQPPEQLERLFREPRIVTSVLIG